MLKTQVARDNIAKAGLSNVVKVVEGPAADTLAKMQPGGQPFDFVFIDADKENNLTYLLEAKRLTRKGAVIVSTPLFTLEAQSSYADCRQRCIRRARS